MLKLGGSDLEMEGFDNSPEKLIVKIETSVNRPKPLRIREAFLSTSTEIPSGYSVYLALKTNASLLDHLPNGTRKVIFPEHYNYLAEGDVILLQPKTHSFRALFRRGSPHNSFLVTERCNHYCLMCSQPPKKHDDSWLADEILETIPLIDPSTKEIGFTGGEPTLLGDDFLEILRTAKSYLPSTSVHILSNGRRFSDPEFVSKYADVNHPDMMVGIPIYSDISTIHDYVVQSDGAFDATIKGILNLKRLGQKVELRVVIQKQTYQRLPQLAEFFVRNLTFVDHIALMGLEMVGFTKANLDDLWIDPFDYRDHLYKAVTLLADYRMNVSIYNHQLCVLHKDIWPFSRKSISDWKNEYMKECSDCEQMTNCGGFFSSAKFKYSDYIKPFSSAKHSDVMSTFPSKPNSFL